MRRELEALGVPFRTQSDTEVLANALRLWGADALPRLNGMFAFVAVWVDTGHFLAGRDRYGAKPLYVANVGTGYIFCSEIRPLLTAAPEAEALFVPPGHVLTRNALSPFPAAAVDPVDQTDLDDLLADAVERRVPPDLPFAFLFSGGVDSTLVTHYARRWRPDAPGYFLGDAGAPDYPYAAAYADRTGFDLRLVPLDLGPADGATLVDEVVATVEAFEPETVRAGLCSYVLSRRVGADGFRVALAGEGADEFFAGYLPLELGYASSEALGHSLREQCIHDMHRTCLQRIDRCGMRFQLEVREPFLDPAVTAHALASPAESLVGAVGERRLGKAALRRLYDLYPDALPASIRDRSKSPLNEGAGLDASQTSSPWRDLADAAIGDAEWADGRKEFAAFDLRDKEELFYMRRLSETLDVWRVPHLRRRPRLVVPEAFATETFKDFIVE